MSVEKDFNEVTSTSKRKRNKLKRSIVFMDPAPETFLDRIKSLISNTTVYELNLSEQSDTH